MSNLIDDFWGHSLKCWDNAITRQACLDIQNQHMVDINILLLLHWLDCNNQHTDELDILFQLSGDHQRRILRPLRTARKGLKGTDMYQSIKSIELEAERMEQAALIKAIDIKQGGNDLVQSLTSYFKFMSIIAPEAEAKQIVTYFKKT